MELDYKFNSRWMDSFINDNIAIVFFPYEGQEALNTFLECICDAFQINHDCHFSISSEVAMAVDCDGIIWDQATGMETLKLMYCRSAWYQENGYALIHWREFINMISEERADIINGRHDTACLSQENIEALL